MDMAVEVGRFEREPEGRPVTQAEAAEMIELWSRSAPAGGPMLDLRDVMEALHISEGEAQRLLAQVRKNAPAESVAPLPKGVVVALYTLLALSLAVATTGIVTAGLVYLHRNPELYVLRPNYFVLLVCLPWTLGWLLYYRRPIWRVVGGIGRRMVEGKR